MSSDKNSADAESVIPPDDPKRELTVARPETDKKLRTIALVGDVYTILVSGGDTDGRYCLIDMQIPPKGGPPPHRHDFEEVFSISEGEIEFTFRGEKNILRAGETINIPANAPHNFTNATDKPAKMLCLCAPAGQDEYFLQIGDPLESRDSKPPELTDAEKKERAEKGKKLAAKYKTEILAP